MYSNCRHVRRSCAHFITILNAYSIVGSVITVHPPFAVSNSDRTKSCLSSSRNQVISGDSWVRVYTSSPRAFASQWDRWLWFIHYDSMSDQTTAIFRLRLPALEKGMTAIRPDKHCLPALECSVVTVRISFLDPRIGRPDQRDGRLLSLAPGVVMTSILDQYLRSVSE
jgi:hypothetical protein